MNDLIWPIERVSEALGSTAAACGFSDPPGRMPSFQGHRNGEQDDHDGASDLPRFLDRIAASLDVDLHCERGWQPVMARDVADPSLLILGNRAIAWTRRSRRSVTLMTRSGARTISNERFSALLREGFDADERTKRLDDTLTRLGVPETSRNAFVAKQRSQADAVGPSIFRLVRREDGPAKYGLFDSIAARTWVMALLAHVASHIAYIGSWILLGEQLLRGRFEPGLMFAWGLSLTTKVALDAFERTRRIRLTIRVGSRLRRRLLDSALQTSSARAAELGQAGALASVLEGHSLESRVVAGTLATVQAAFELAIASLMLLLSGGIPHALVALGWIGLGIAWGAKLLHHRREAVSARARLAAATVAVMLGRRTRVAQCDPASWHEDEHRALANYERATGISDGLSSRLSALLPRVYLVTAMAVWSAQSLLSEGASLSSAAVLGAALLMYRALLRAAGAGDVLIDARVSWERAAVSLRPNTPRAPRGEGLQPRPRPDVPVLELRNVSVRPPGRDADTLDRATTLIQRGDRWLVVGPSGAGKSTLASVAAAIITPRHGAVLLHGLDLATVGRLQWNHRVAWIPQYHDNHVLSGTLLFNLLLGRTWPPERKDMQDAMRVSYALGLGPLIERMPSGSAEFVGDQGWRLSHGERSRVFLARALLARPDVAIFDESFAALDPETLRNCVDFVCDEVPTSVVVSHP